jgi:N-acetylmuramoyl-L-alanine amidase
MKKPQTIPRPSPNFDCRRTDRDIQAVVLHGTGMNNAFGVLARLRNPASRRSVHYLVDENGRIYQLVAENDRAWHAGYCRWHGEPTDMDEHSIGIDIVGNGHPYTEKQYSKLAELLAYLVTKYDLLDDDVVLHREVALGRNDGPPDSFDFQHVKALLTERRKETAAPETPTAAFPGP